MTCLFGERCNGRVPYSWQLDVSETLLLGLNSVVIAGTGAGKTVPFMLPLLVEKNKKIIIISPLKALQRDQRRRFKQMGISACALNGNTWGPRLKKRLQNHTYQAIMTSPEMCVEHPEVRELLSSTDFSKDIIGFIIDEAHCISQWGGDFRKPYGMLDKLQAFVASCIPFLATSATITHSVLGQITGKLNIDLEKSFYLNLGNDRPNVASSVMEMKNQKDFEVLKDLIAKGVWCPDDLTKTIIFTNSIRLTLQIRHYIRKVLPPSCHTYVDAFHALRALKAKRCIMKKFHTGRVKILIATEAAGMGADIPDVELVIQFEILARAILLVEKSMFLRRKLKSKSDKGKASEDVDDIEADVVDEWEDAADDDAPEDGETIVDVSLDGKEWMKKVDPSLRAWIETQGCRHNASDRYFNNPPRLTSLTGTCYDWCSRGTADTSEERPLTPTSTAVPSTQSTPRSHHVTPHPSPLKAKNRNGKHQMAPRSETPKICHDDHLKKARVVLEKWRLDLKRAHYTSSSFTASALLPETILTTLVSNGTIQTLVDLKSALKTPWILADDHGEEVIRLLREVDQRRLREMEVKKKRKKSKVTQTVSACARRFLGI